MEKKFICIVCPMGCELTAQTDGEGNLTAVDGNRCKRGEIYAQQECKAPTRMLTSTVRIENGLYPRLPVITSESVPKDKLFEVMAEINRVKVTAPIALRQVIIKNVCGLSADVIASRSMERFLP